MITANVTARVFFIKGEDYGSSFAIDYQNRQYLITAKHIVPPTLKNGCLQLYHNKTWKNLGVELVGSGEGEIDITVLAPKVRLSSEPNPAPTSGNIIIGQDVYFLGFPYKMWSEVGKVNHYLPFPFIKKGILSSPICNENGIHCFFIDAMNNQGFSGGPIVFSDPSSSKLNYKVAGVVSKFIIEYEPVVTEEDKKSGLKIAYNTGFLIGYGIKHAIDLIKQNPIGFKIE